jgi:hypothetical protein
LEVEMEEMPSSGQVSKDTDIVNEELGLRIGIEEMQKNLEAQFEGMDAMKDIARTLFGSSTLIAGLYGVLQLSTLTISDPVWLSIYIIVFALTIIAYVSTVICSIIIISPVTLNRPVVDEWDQIYKHFTNKSKIEILRVHLAAYISTIKANNPILEKRRKLVKAASVSLVGVVILIMILSFIGRTSV